MQNLYLYIKKKKKNLGKQSIFIFTFVEKKKRIGYQGGWWDRRGLFSSRCAPT